MKERVTGGEWWGWQVGSGGGGRWGVVRVTCREEPVYDDATADVML